VAVDAVRSPTHERQPSLRRRCVAPLAIHGDVRSSQGEARLLMHTNHPRTVEKVARGVAARAVGAELTAMHVPVTSRALGGRTFEVERRVTRPARRLAVSARQWESRFRVVERGADPRGNPAFGRMARGARLRQRSMRVLGGLLRSDGRAREQTHSERQDDRFHRWQASQAVATGR